MNIKLFIKVTTLVCFVMLCLYLVGIMALSYALEQSQKISANQAITMALTRETAENSLKLTVNVRNYLATGDEKFKEAYWGIINTREGKIARPANAIVAPGRQVPLDTLFDEAGFTSEEKFFLNRVNQLSTKLAKLEIQAMDIVETASAQELLEAKAQAINLLHNDAYLKAADAIVTPVAEFEKHLKQRQAENREAPVHFAWKVQAVLFVLAALTGLLIIGALGWMRRRMQCDLRALKATEAERDVVMEEKKDIDKRIRIMLDTLPIICNFWDTNPPDANSVKTKITLPDELTSKNVYLIETNSAAANLFGLPNNQVYLDHFKSLSPEFQPDGCLSAELMSYRMAKTLSEGTASIFEWVHQTLDGTPIPCEVTLVRVPYGDGFTVVGYIRDLREIKKAQAELDVERQMLKKIMDTAPISFATTVNGVIQFINPFAEHLTGSTIGKKIEDIFMSPNVYTEVSNELFKNKFVNWHPIEIKRNDGQIASMLLNSFETDYYGKVGIMCWFIDVTKISQQNQELALSRKMAEEATEAKSNFLANMSHEIRTSMNAILGLIYLLLQSDLGTIQREYLVKTEGVAKLLLRIINDILDFSKIEAGKLEMEKETLCLNAMLQNSVDVASITLDAKALEYVISVQPNTPTRLIGDQVRLLQIINNLTSNAIKFTEQGQVVLKVEIVCESHEEVTLRFSVQDTGIGLTEKQLKTIFSPFTQADTSTTRHYGGTGLGLVISKRLVEMMGGTIWVESESGHGSTFCFTAKFKIPDELPKPDLGTGEDFRGLSALVIDDTPVALECLSTLLKAIGIEVKTATSGHEALNILADCKHCEKHFDLIFIDRKMPGMDGMETAKRIKQLLAPLELPMVLMASTNNCDETPEQLQQANIRSVMIKPILSSTVHDTLFGLFDREFLGKASVPKIEEGTDISRLKDFIGARILLAEDNEINQLVASSILQNEKIIVDIANNGLEAVNMVKTGQYKLVLMDIQMPVMDGIAATREIRSMPEFANLPILAMTAHAMIGDREMSLKAGMNDHISKPIDVDEMFSTLAKWLNKDIDVTSKNT